MTTSLADPKEAASKLMAYLRTLRNDRGAMADLRCALVPARRARAWPLLARVGGIERPAYEAVAGWFGYHPDESRTGNLGATCRALAAGNSTFDGRFRRLLACDREDVIKLIRPVILAARAKEIPVNYEELFADLCYWGDRVKARWAKEFWGAPAQAVEGKPCST